MQQIYDYIVIGSGSAGAVVAARLSEQPGVSVALLEAGGRDWNPMLHIPMASGKLLRRGLHGWNYLSESLPGCADRRLQLPRGKVLGGSSSINGMVYVRGHRADFDAWAAAGASGWSFADVLPYFLKAEGHLTRADAFHNTNGPLRVSRALRQNPLYEAFIMAGLQAGHTYNDDFNGAVQDGVGFFDFNIAQGRRSSTASAYLRDQSTARTLVTFTRAHVTRIVLNGSRAEAVEFVHRGKLQSLRARREIILCAGVFNSPQILLLSGIGPARELEALRIRVAQDLPGVGTNLADHVDVPVRYSCPRPVTMHSMIRADRAALGMAQAVLQRRGWATSFPTEAGAFLKTDRASTAPNLQLHFSISLGGSRLRVPLLWRIGRGAFEYEGFQIRPCVLRPKSRGRVRLQSNDPFTPPRIDLGLLTEREDIELLLQGIEMSRSIGAQTALAPFITAETTPGPAVRGAAELEMYVRREAASAHHAVGTCRMGRGEDAVVDPSLRVRGIDGLRVADASIMPAQIGGNTHAATVMIGEKAADMILGRKPGGAATG